MSLRNGLSPINDGESGAHSPMGAGLSVNVEVSPLKLGGGTIYEIDFEEDEFHTKYVQLEKLGEGGAASVYKIKQRSDERLYAAKMMANRDSEKAETSRDEFNLLNSIKPHPNIVGVKEFIETECWTYLILDYVPG